MEITADMFRVESEIENAWTLHGALYTDPKVFAAEKEKIFSRTWQVAGHASQVANTGDYFTTELVGEPLVCVRGAELLPCALADKNAVGHRLRAMGASFYLSRSPLATLPLRPLRSVPDQVAVCTSSGRTFGNGG